jgi:hypothetical protein
VFAHPGMIERGVIADEIEEQAHAAGVQFISNAVEGIPGADASVGDVSCDGVGRGDYVIWFPSGECAIELRKVPRVFEHDAARFGTASPDAHEPDDVETAFGDGIPGGVGDVVELNHAAEIGGDAFEPAPGIYFVEVRVRLDAGGGGGDAWCDGHRVERKRRDERVSMERRDSFDG